MLKKLSFNLKNPPQRISTSAWWGGSVVFRKGRGMKRNGMRICPRKVTFSPSLLWLVLEKLGQGGRWRGWKTEAYCRHCTGCDFAQGIPSSILVLSMKQESPATAEKVQRPSCVLLAGKINSLGSSLPSLHPASRSRGPVLPQESGRKTTSRLFSLIFLV